jgi:hypothetical protein
LKPTEGRIVNYVLPTGRNAGQVRPAIIVRVWPDNDESIQLQVFTDCTNDGTEYSPGVVWKTSVHHDQEGKAPGTWHWMEYQVGQAAKTEALEQKLASVSGSVRAKFRCMSNIEGVVSMWAVTDGSEENKAFWNATPGGSISLTITNPDAVSFFNPGDEIYVDFTRAK